MFDKKKTAADEAKSEADIWAEDHAKLVEASKLAQKAVFEHRNVPAEVKLAKEAAAAEEAGNTKAADEKKATADAKKY